MPAQRTAFYAARKKLSEERKSQLTRLSVDMPIDELRAFEEWAIAQGYETRTQAVRSVFADVLQAKAPG